MRFNFGTLLLATLTGTVLALPARKIPQAALGHLVIANG